MDEVSGSAVQVRYTFGNMLVSQTRNPSILPMTSFYGRNAHGNIAFLTSSTGIVTDTYQYDAWGILVTSTGSTRNSRLFAGEEFDDDIGAINMRRRQYFQNLGRFSSRDILYGRNARPLTTNQYLYAADDPVIRTDPSGKTDALEEGLDITFGLLEIGDIALGISVPGLLAGC
jgi:RHS repeat-associated protein